MAGSVKHSYTVPCSSAFRDAALDLAEKRRVNVGDLARSVLLAFTPETINEFPDPGDPEPGDRETVHLKSGPSAGRPWRRKPRLQVRMVAGHDVLTIRKALGIALALDKGHVEASLDNGSKAVEEAARAAETALVEAALAEERARHAQTLERALSDAREESLRLRTMLEALLVDPLPGGINSRQDALHVLGFPPGTRPDTRQLRSRFRILATIHHPDSQTGNHHRMSQLNAAMDYLRNG